MMTRLPHLPVTPAALMDARALIANPDQAAAAPVSLRRLAWAVCTTAHGGRTAQRHRPANSTGGPR